MSADIISLAAMDDALERIDAKIDDALVLADLGDFNAAMAKIIDIRAMKFASDAPALFLRKRVAEACDGLLWQLGRTAGLLDASGGKEPA